MTNPPKTGQRVFVLSDSPHGRRIMFETTVDAAYTPEGAPVFVVTVDGMKFTADGDEFVLRADDRPLYLLPANDSTVELVRAAQRPHKHALREARKSQQTRVAQARADLDRIEAEIEGLKRRQVATRRWVTQRQDDYQQAAHRLRSVEAMRDGIELAVASRMPSLERELAKAKLTLAKIRNVPVVDIEGGQVETAPGVTGPASVCPTCAGSWFECPDCGVRHREGGE